MAVISLNKRSARMLLTTGYSDSQAITKNSTIPALKTTALSSIADNILDVVDKYEDLSQYPVYAVEVVDTNRLSPA